MMMATDMGAFCLIRGTVPTGPVPVRESAGNARYGGCPTHPTHPTRPTRRARSRSAVPTARAAGPIRDEAPMRIGANYDETQPFDSVVRQVAALAERGIGTAWSTQIFGADALTVLAAVSREVPGIGFGTAVVPTYPRHPVMLAAQALTVQEISGGRLTLGIGLSHQMVIENMFGLSFDKPARHMREYLEVLVPLLAGEQVTFAGETLRVSTFGPLEVTAPVPDVLVAALGTVMLRIAGRMASGTVTWMTGPVTIEEHVVPTIVSAAAEAGRARPRVAVGLPVCVTDDVATARATAAEKFGMYGYLPSYRAMLDREGVEGPADVAIVGTAAEVTATVRRMDEVGATDFCGAPFGTRDEITATLDTLGALAGV